MTQIEPTTPIAVTLQAQQWNMVLGFLADGSVRVALPLIQAIQQQCMQQAGGEVPESAARGNGEARESP